MSITSDNTATVNVHIFKTQWLMFKNYCYLIENTQTKQGVLVDPSWEFNKINATMQQSSIKPLAILLTHHHPDHIHLADKCARYFNIPVYMSKTEIDFYGFRCTHLKALPALPSLTIGDIDVNIIPTPGHTVGGVCYLIGKHLFTGDTLFNEGCGMCTDNGASPDAMFDSLQNLLRILADDTLIYPGHRYHRSIPQTFAKVKANNIYLQLNKREAFVAFRMRKQTKRNWFNFK